MNKILIIEDDADICEELTFLLKNEGYDVMALTRFHEIVEQVKEFCPDLILLDIGLPEQDGFLLCKSIRMKSQVPIIFVTSRDSTLDELKALSLGGDDYVTKPYNIPVLLARVKVALRRKTGTDNQQECIEAKELQLDSKMGVIRYHGQSCEVTKNEIKILCCLMQQPGRIVPRADIIEYLWNDQVYIDDNTLSVNVTRLRAKLDELGAEGYITTKRGMGYKI